MGHQEDPSFDGLTGVVQECFGLDPLTGHLFLFLNRR
ncbi:IS66 family insertion sequence element accessory protein TnpB [Singulisphaera acidiphila]